MKKIILISLSCLLVSCIGFSEKEILGRYVPKDYIYSYDTIIIQEKGIYERRVYDIDNQLVLNMKGKWCFTDNFQVSIQFDSFFLNFDRDLRKFPELVSDTTGSWTGPFEKEKGIIKFCVGYLSASLSNQNCYYKIEN